MIPLIIAGVFLAVFAISAIVAICKGPTNENETVKEMYERMKREEEKRRNEQAESELERERKRAQERAQEMAAIRKKQEEVALKMREAEIREKRARAQTTWKNKEEEERVARKHEEEERAARQRKEEEEREFAARMEEFKIREDRLKEKADQLERAAKLAEKKFSPLRWPTQQEFQETLRATQYSNANFHFAIVGRAGSGKSSLINAFRNLRNKEAGAAPTGTKETTLQVKRYKDPGDQPPRQWMVWFDVPGAGTQSIPHHDYFVKQGLYVFDSIILAIGDRFEEIDARILENCAKFKVPAFIVRSKADMHILNSMKEYGDYDGINDDRPCYEKCRDKFIDDTQRMVSEELKKGGLPDQHVYIVSRDELQWVYHNSLKLSATPTAWARRERLIHEDQLVGELLTAAARRRCGWISPNDWVKDKYSAAQELINRQCENLGFSDPPVTRQGIQISQTVAPVVADTQREPSYQANEVRKVIKPKKPTNAKELYREISENNPELPNMLIGAPRMFSPRVALLTFYPLAPIPQKIFVFGAWLRVEEYKERKKEGGAGGHAQTKEKRRATGEGSRNNSTPARDDIHTQRGRGGNGRGGTAGGHNEW